MSEQDQGRATSDETQVHAQDDQEEQETKEEKNLTWEEHQRELRRVGKKEKSEGRTSREKELLEKSGAESIDEILAAYEAHKLTEAEMQSEADKEKQRAAKLEEQLNTLKSEREEALKLADERLVDSELKSALISSGVDASRVKKILRDPDIEKPSVEDGEVEGVENYVKAAKKEWPELFSKKERVPESPEPFTGQDPAKDNEARAAFQRSYARNF
jgi:hypothetical protein